MKKHILSTAVLLALSTSVFADGHLKGAGHGEGPRELTKQQFIEQAGKRFDLLDANKDGKVTREEARAAHEKMRDRREDRRENRPAEAPRGDRPQR